MLGGAASLPRVDQLDAVVFLQHADVVGDQVEALVELLREHVRARDLLIQNDQDLHSQGMGERFRDYLFDALFFVFRLRQGLFPRLVCTDMADNKTLAPVNQDFHNAPAFSDY
jgi:hypothetical protein